MAPDAPHSGSFELIAEVYDLLMRGVPYQTWVSYYLLLLATVGFKPKRLLDVACGTGTMALMLTEEGFEMAGFDLSAAMIEVARRKAYK
ncbi:class I SAM-dependent methyltransferase [bacterium]|nr:MAG: class I SAM-dependent methyltransferase [bacterium]